MDFGAFPPEFNSARMYAGPGSGPMLAAASAWDVLAAELGSAASSYGSVVSSLAGVFATAGMRSNCGMIIHLYLSRLSWGDVGVVALDALFCPVNGPPVRGAQR